MNYADLKTICLSYAYNRKDLVSMIPFFLTLAERRIFRVLRSSANETVKTFGLATGDSAIPLPPDYLEARLVTIDSTPLKATDDINLLKNRSAHTASAGRANGHPTRYARIGDYLELYPACDADCTATMVYYQDLTGTLIADNDTNNVLRIAPDLYVYGLMIEICAYLVDDARRTDFESLFGMALAAIAEQDSRAELSGSVVSMRQVQ